MGTWGRGAFDNDAAADFAGDVDEAEGPGKAARVRAALETVADGAGELGGHDEDVAVAAAALVAAQCPGGEPWHPIYGPKEKVPPLPVELRELAVRALDHVLGPESAVAELWGSGDDAEEWRSNVLRLRAVLGAAV